MKIFACLLLLTKIKKNQNSYRLSFEILTPKTSPLSHTELSLPPLALQLPRLPHKKKKYSLHPLHRSSLPDLAGSKNNSGFLASPSAPPPSLTLSWSAADPPRPDPQVLG